ncbi:MAG: PQQ-binding-like beta-propeller repeat protein, partial [Acidobacteria bacterium]|nr:PQQ-binding-like beta-propeller repeat protein [Acidobacteriota bacterium]
PKTRNSIIATPVFHNGKVFLASGQDPENGSGVGHMYCIDPTKRGDITETGRIWHNEKILRTVSTAAILDDMIFISDFAGFFHCLDIDSGKPLWTYDALAAIWGSPLVADGKVYIGDEDGDVAILEAGKEMKLIAEINMGSALYGTPVAANGVLYVMSRDALYAIASEKKE